MDEEIKKYLTMTYNCGWNNTIRESETNNVIELDELISRVSGIFTIKVHKAELCLMSFLLETTGDVTSASEYWIKNRGNGNIHLQNLVSAGSLFDAMYPQRGEIVTPRNPPNYIPTINTELWFEDRLRNVAGDHRNDVPDSIWDTHDSDSTRDIN